MTVNRVLVFLLLAVGVNAQSNNVWQFPPYSSFPTPNDVSNDQIVIGSSSISILGWIYPTTTSRGIIASKDRALEPSDQFRFMRHADGRLAIWASGIAAWEKKLNDGCSPDGTYCTAATTADPVPNNIWINFAWIRTPVNHRLYLNGTLVINVTATPFTHTGTWPFKVGSRNSQTGSGIDSAFVGQINNVTVVVGTALNLDQINSILYNTSYNPLLEQLGWNTTMYLLGDYSSLPTPIDVRNNDIVLGDRSITTVGWIYLYDYAGVVASKDGSGGGADQFRMEIHPSGRIGIWESGIPDWLLRDGPTCSPDAYGYCTAATTNATIAKFTWIHYAWVRTSTLVTLYLDGQVALNQTKTAFTHTQTYPFKVGSRAPEKIDRPFAGNITGSRVFLNAALTKEQVGLVMAIIPSPNVTASTSSAFDTGFTIRTSFKSDETSSTSSTFDTGVTIRTSLKSNSVLSTASSSDGSSSGIVTASSSDQFSLSTTFSIPNSMDIITSSASGKMASAILFVIAMNLL